MGNIALSREDLTENLAAADAEMAAVARKGC
jgi:hypothetical protein